MNRPIPLEFNANVRLEIENPIEFPSKSSSNVACSSWMLGSAPTSQRDVESFFYIPMFTMFVYVKISIEIHADFIYVYLYKYMVHASETAAELSAMSQQRTGGTCHITQLI